MTLFTSQSAAAFYDKLLSSLDFTLPRAATGRRGFPKEAMVCAFIVMKCEGFAQITDLMDYLDNNRLIAHYPPQGWQTGTAAAGIPTPIMRPCAC